MSKSRMILRKEMRIKRDGIDDKAIKDKLIYDAFFEIEQVKKSDSFFVYVSMNGEVDTCGIIENLLSLGRIVCVPFTSGGIMSVKRLLKPPETFVTDKLGNLCGVYEVEAADFECDCAVIPMLAFNERLFRLGYGGGYYDRYLSSYGGFKLGLSYGEQFCDEFKESEHDIRLDAILTQDKVLRRKGESVI